MEVNIPDVPRWGTREEFRELASRMVAYLKAAVAVGIRPEEAIMAFEAAVSRRCYGLSYKDSEEFMAFHEGMAKKMVWFYREGFFDPVEPPSDPA